NFTIEAAINWVIEHENDPDIDQMPLVPINIEIENGTSWTTPDEVKIKLLKLRCVLIFFCFFFTKEHHQLPS
ncbi:hypothetical protein B296_00059274, partial [Ensete ventricosum]